MRLNVQEVRRAYDFLRLDAIESHFRNIEQRINDVINTTSFTGAAASGMKAYLKEVHGLAVKSFIVIIMEIDSGLKHFLTTVEQVDKDERAILDRKNLEYIYDIAEQHKRKIQDKFNDFNSEISRALSVMDIPSQAFMNAMRDLEHHLKIGMNIIEETESQMQSFDNYHMRELEQIKDHLNTLEQVLNQITGVLSGNMKDFKVGSFTQSELGQTLFAHMITATLSISRNGQTEEAMEALTLIGGYMSTLPEEMRQQLFQVKGRALACAYIGDPVNAVTGNFIYDNTDIKITGRHTLEFKRFYNALDDVNRHIGKNWTHNFDIRLSEIEKGVTIYYADSRQEYFSDTTENINKLNKLEDNSYELIFPDDSKYMFNSDGQLTLQIDKDGYEVKLSYEDELLTKVENISGSFEISYIDNHIEKVTDHTGRVVSYEYENDLLTKYTNSSCNTYTYDYDLRNRLVKLTNPEGNILAENTYDDKDRVTNQLYADGSKMLYNYRDFSKETIFTKQNDSKFIYKRDEQYRTTGIEEPNGEIKIEYNDRNQRTKHIDKLGNETSFEYDTYGNMSKVTNALGVVTELEYLENSDKLQSVTISGNKKVQNTYNEEGNLISLEDSLSNKTTISYAKKSLIETITQADGSQIHLKYDERENIAEIKDGSGIITKYKYDLLNRITCTIDGNENETHFHYDNQNNIVKVIDSASNVQSFEYNKLNKITSIIDWAGNEVKREYNSLGRLSKVIDGLNRATSFEYDKMWNVSKITEANGAITEFLYNEMNYLESITKPDQNKIGYKYDLNGNRIKAIDENGNETNLIYDALNRLTSVVGGDGLKYEYTYNDEGKVTSIVDMLGNTVNLEYDSLGQIVKETNILGNSRTYTYTPLGKISTITDEAGRVKRYEYELGGKIKCVTHLDNTKESFTYDNNGNLKTHTNKANQTTTYSYDTLNRVAETEINDSKKQYRYDAMSNVTSITDELGNKTTYEYTITGQLSKVIDPLNSETLYKYDERDQLIEILQNGEQQTKYERDLMGQITQITDPLGNIEKFQYNPKGELIEKIDKEGFLTKYNYSIHGDVTKIQYADGKEVEASYNTLRQLTEIKDWLGTTQIKVDSLGRATEVINHNKEVTSYTYGKTGEQTEIKYPNGRTVTYSYDEALRLAKVNDGEQDITYQYDELSRLTSKNFGDTTKTEYSYNKLGQLSKLTNIGTERILDQYKYSYDKLGNKTSIEKLRKGLEADSGLFSYSYDGLNRLSEISKDGDLLRSYNYDIFGNRISKIDDGEETSYTYNSLNQLILSSDGMNYIYDKRGNLTETHKNNVLINKYEFGAINRLEKVFNHETNESSVYRYNGLGHRTGKTIGDLTLNPTKHIEDVLDLTKQYNNLLQRSEDSNTTTYTWDTNLLSSNNSHYLLDELGSPIRFRDEVLSYDEFGISQTATAQPFGFTGYQHDNIADTMYAQAREFMPNIGRFASEDLVKGIQTQPFTFNSYSYCFNQPLNLVDLDGNWPQWVQDTWEWTSDTVSSIGNTVSNIDWWDVGFNVTGSLVVDKNPVFSTLNFIYQGATLVGRVGYSDDQERVFNSTVSNYRGQIVIRSSNNGRSGSLGPIMLLNPALQYNSFGVGVLRHEHGHFLEYQQLGFLRYFLGIGYPSLTNPSFKPYFNQPWEVHADMIADNFFRDSHTVEAIALGFAYFEHLYGIRSFGDWFNFLRRDLWDFANHDLSALKQDGA